MSNNRESEYTQPEDFLDLSPYDDLDCEMELDRESMFEIYEPEKETESQETDKEKSETGEQECMEHSVQEKVEFNSDDGFDPVDCSMGSPKRVDISLEEFSDDADRMNETEMRKLMTAPIKINPEAQNLKKRNRKYTSDSKSWALEPVTPSGRKANEKNSFQNRRNKWMRLEKLPAHRRLPPKENASVKKWTRSINFKTCKAISIACKYQNWTKISELLAEAEQNQEMLTALVVRRLSLAILHTIYKGYKIKKHNLPLEMFPRYMRASVASVNLCDPIQLLNYFQFPSLGYKLNSVNTAEIVWRRVGCSHRARIYRIAFEKGAALIKHQK
jgi:hypothetical protein